MYNNMYEKAFLPSQNSSMWTVSPMSRVSCLSPWPTKFHLTKKYDVEMGGKVILNEFRTLPGWNGSIFVLIHICLQIFLQKASESAYTQASFLLQLFLFVNLTWARNTFVSKTVHTVKYRQFEKSLGLISKWSECFNLILKLNLLLKPPSVT